MKKKPGFARKHHEKIKMQNRADLDTAIREAESAGKEPFDVQRLTDLAGVGDLRPREQALREMYYISNREIQTLAEFADRLREQVVWGNF